jgi:hypothetical protein
MSESQEVFTSNYLPAFWYAMGKSEDNLGIATEFANHYALARMENASGPSGIPDSFKNWLKSL